MSRSASAQIERRQELLRAAASVFAQRGYERAKVAEIAATANVATGTFYLYFPSKEACFLDLVAQLYEIVLQRVTAARQGQADVLRKLKASITAVLETFEDERDLAAVVLLQGSGSLPQMAERLRSVEDNLAQLLAQDLKEAADTGLIARGDASLRAHLVIGAMREALLYRLRQPAQDGSQDETVRAFLLHALG